MAKTIDKFNTKNEKYPYPSHYGSHASMVDEAATKALNDSNQVVCKDEHGKYTTLRSRLDSGLADPNRNAQSRLEYMCPKSSAQ